ncbi:MAG: glycosyltransferase [Planctomycetota bacterium]|nr:glycosyltransferase [Planctomycetota bacterium]
MGDGAAQAGHDLSAPLTVVVPVYNEGENFREWWRRAGPHLPPGTVVRPVYDMPDDDTLPVIEALRAEGAPIEPLRNEARGVLRALLNGLRSVERGPVLVSMADLSDDLSVVPRMLEAWRGGAAVVVASRYMPGGRHVGGPWLKKALSRLGGLSLHLAGFPARDATNNFRLYDAAFVRSVEIESRAGFELALELTLKAWEAGREVVEVPTTWTDRVAGESRFALRKWLPHYARLWARGVRHGLSRRRG